MFFLKFRPCREGGWIQLFPANTTSENIMKKIRRQLQAPQYEDLQLDERRGRYRAKGCYLSNISLGWPRQEKNPIFSPTGGLVICGSITNNRTSFRVFDPLFYAWGLEVTDQRRIMELSDLIQSVPSPNLFAPDGASVKNVKDKSQEHAIPGG